MSKRMSVFAGNSQEGVKNQGVPFLLLLPPFFFFLFLSRRCLEINHQTGELLPVLLWQMASTARDGGSASAGLRGEFCSGRQQGAMCRLPSAFI